MLFAGLRSRGVYRPRPGWLRLSVQIAVAAVVMTAVVLWLGNGDRDWYAMTVWAQAGWLSLSILGGVGAYFASCWIAGLRPEHFRMHAQDGLL